MLATILPGLISAALPHVLSFGGRAISDIAAGRGIKDAIVNNLLPMGENLVAKGLPEALKQSGAPITATLNNAAVNFEPMLSAFFKAMRSPTPSEAAVVPSEQPFPDYAPPSNSFAHMPGNVRFKRMAADLASANRIRRRLGY